MSRSDLSKTPAKPRSGSRAQRRGSKGAAGRARRPVQIHNGCRGLRFSRRDVAAVIHLLDARAAEIVGLRPPAHRRPPSGHGRLTLDPRPATASGPPPGELSVAFLTEAALAALHGRFLGDRSATDVITFAGDAALGQAGEICVSAAAARAFAEKRGGDFSAELTLYLVHGWLHLAGHDDLAPVRKRRMRAAEARAMALLCAAEAIPPFRLK